MDYRTSGVLDFTPPVTEHILTNVPAPTWDGGWRVALEPLLCMCFPRS